MLRKTSAAYIQATDEAVEKGLQVADQVLVEGQKELAKQLDGVDPRQTPAALRVGLQSLKAAVQPRASLEVASDEAAEARKIRERFPDRVPVMCERSRYSDLPPISKKKFAVPGSMLCSEFKYMLHKHILQAMPGESGAEKTIYIFVNGVAPKTSTPMSELYAQSASSTGFLHISYSAENTLGMRFEFSSFVGTSPLARPSLNQVSGMPFCRFRH